MNEPPITLFVRGVDRWRCENEWPLSRTKWTKYYLRSWGRLTPEPEEFVNISPDCYAQPPLTVTNSIQSLTYVTAPMQEDTEVTGPIALRLYASISSKDTNWIVTLKDIGQDATEVELTRGWLKASHRALDMEKTKPYQPYHTHTKPEPITPGEIYEYAIEIRPTSNVFKAGHRIKLEIMSADLPGKTIFEPDHLNSSHTTIHYIYHDRKYDSFLLLPIIPFKES
jgi:putative CocE/NonD family hydrolase